MRTLYLFITDTLADWESGHFVAELRSGRYLKDPAPKYNVVLCGRTLDTIITRAGTAECLQPGIPQNSGDPTGSDHGIRRFPPVSLHRAWIAGIT